MKNKKSTTKNRLVAFILATACALGALVLYPFANTIDISDIDFTQYPHYWQEGYEDKMVTSMDIYKTIDTTVKTFPDVSYNNWYFESVMQAVQMGFLNGYDDGTFGPTASITRAQLCQILYNYEGQPAVTSKSVFTDVGDTKWYAKPVIWASENGIVTGYGDGKFGPNDSVTREQLATILYRYTGSPSVSGSLSAFTDSGKVGKWSIDACIWSVNNGIISGTTTTTLDPKGSATRAQVATIMIRYARQIRGDTIPVIDTAVLNGSKNLNGSTNAAYVNSVSSVGKSNSYPTIGQADTANANGYFTEADVDIEGAVLCYDALDYIHQALGNYGLVWTTCDEAEEYTLMRAKEVYNMLIENNWDCYLKNEDGAYVYHYRPDGSYAAMTENIAMAATKNGSGTTKQAVTNWLNSSGHRAQMTYTSAECCVARYKNVWVYTVQTDGECVSEILFSSNNYYRNSEIVKAFKTEYPYFVYVGLM